MRRQHVSLFAVGVEEQSDPGGTIRVVFDRGHARRNPEFVPFEIDDPVETLCAAALVPDRNSALIIAAGFALQRLGQTLLGPLVGDLVKDTDAHRATTGRGRFVFAYCHDSLLLAPLDLFEDVDAEAWLQRHDRLFPGGLVAFNLAAAPARGA